MVLGRVDAMVETSPPNRQRVRKRRQSRPPRTHGCSRHALSNGEDPMNRIETVHSGSFASSDDKCGRYTINIYETILHHADGSLERFWSLLAEDGRHVHRKGKGEYVIAESG